MVDSPLATGETDPVNAAAAAAIDCQVDEAVALLNNLPTLKRYDAGGLLVGLFAARITSEPDEQLLQLATLRYPILAFLATTEIKDASPFSSLADDVQVYRRRSVPPPPQLETLPISESGLSAWLRDPVRAADAGAPASGLAACR
jgi:hypothetical protein